MNKDNKNIEKKKALILYPNLHMMLVPSVAVGLFTTICKNNDFEVELFDTTEYEHDSTTSAEKRVESLQYRPFNPETDVEWNPKPGKFLIPDFIKKVKSYKPDIIFVSIVEDTFIQAVKLLDSIKNMNIANVLGGVFPTAAPEKALKPSSVKMVATGEGEPIVTEILTRINSNKFDFSGIPRLWIKKNNKIVPPTSNGKLVNISRVTPDFSLFEERRFLRPMGGRVFKTLPLETYRGCPFKCTFCNSPMQVTFSKENDLGHFLRRKKMIEVRNILRDLVQKHDPDYIYILDDSFLSRPRKEIFEFAEMYSEFSLPFWFNTRPESCDNEILKALKDVGLDRMSVGLEHGNFDFRNKTLLRKPTNEKLLHHLDLIAKSGVAFSINTIIGFPEETREMVFETIEFCRKLKSFDALTVSIFTPYHGTVLRKRAVDLGFLDEDTLTVHTTSSSLLKMPMLSAETIDGLFRTFLMYVRFEKELWPYIEKAEKFDDVGNNTWKKLFKLYQERYYSTDQDGFSLKTDINDDHLNNIKHPKLDTWEEVFGHMSKTQMR